MKKWLICLTVLFSAFLFANKVSAVSFKSSDIEYLQTKFGTFDCQTIKDIAQINNINTDYYDSFILSYTPYSQMYNYLYFFNSNNTYNVVKNGSSEIDMYGRHIRFWNIKSFNSFPHDYLVNGSSDDSYIYYKGDNYYIINNDYKTSSSVYLAKNFDCQLSEPTSYNVTFHLNGGNVWDTNEVCDDIGCYIKGSKYEDYTSTIQADGLYDYLINQEVEKETMQFVGWYYDEKLTKKVEATDILDSDKDFYAKYQYKNVEDFLNNNTFNSYTFDENYQYAIISLNDQTNRDIYLGLELMSYSFEVYKYNKINLEYHQGASLCLVPIFAKDNKYYYHLDSPLNEDYEVLIIPKEKLNGKYNFLLSSNAYVTYTNDLKNVVIKDESGNDITTDLENSYDYSQNALLKSENDLLEIFKDLINNKDNNVFSYFNQVWNSIKQNRLYIYFITLIIGALIILIIKTASR